MSRSASQPWPADEQRELSIFRGEDLRPSEPSGDWTLSEFFYWFVRPEVFAIEGAAAATLRQYETSIRYWQTATGDPPIKQISGVECRKLLRYLSELPGQGGGKLSIESIRKHCRTLQRLLNLAGPPNGKHSDNQDLYGWEERDAPRGQTVLERRQVPYLKRPPKRRKPVKNVFRAEQYEAVLGTLSWARGPHLPGMKPAEFWLALLEWIDNVGTRIRCTIQLTREMLDGHVLSVPAEILKGRNDREFWVNDRALYAAERIRCAGGHNGNSRLFPVPVNTTIDNTLRQLHRERKRLMALAGVKQHGLGFHGLRKALASRVAKKNPLAAQRQLGHEQMSTLDEYYVDMEAMGDAFGGGSQRDPQMRLF